MIIGRHARADCALNRTLLISDIDTDTSTWNTAEFRMIIVIVIHEGYFDYSTAIILG